LESSSQLDERGDMVGRSCKHMPERLGRLPVFLLDTQGNPFCEVLGRLSAQASALRQDGKQTQRNA
ncbi:MAG: hypothetical protein P8182_19905, partial [Deltaproteobacteria bacterium]